MLDSGEQSFPFGQLVFISTLLYHLTVSSAAVPDSVWRINLDVPEEGKTVSLDNADDRWWEQTDLVKLILASNWLTALSEDIVNLPALTVLDVSILGTVSILWTDFMFMKLPYLF